MPAATPVDELAPTLQRLRDAWMARRPDHAQRRTDLLRLRSALAGRLDEMAAAASADFGHRSRHESLLADGIAVLSEIDHMVRNLRRWMRPQRRNAGWRLWPARAEVRHVPLGAVGVMAPWNYPVALALVPLATAIAAGNHVYLKPSEHAPRVSAFLRDLLAEVFPPERVTVALGGVDLGQAFAALPFDHLMFTGSTAVGREVMAAAARNLTPVTLELGGKSPAIVGESSPIDVAAARIATGKFFNAGQTCIAPDYVLVPASRRDALVAALRSEVARRYADIASSPDYTRVASAAQYQRLQHYLDEARGAGDEVIALTEIGDPDAAAAQRLMPPVVVLEPADDRALMREEIFGPILPVRTYRDLDEAIDFVNARERPLALYHFTQDRSETERLLSRVVAGTVCVNDTLYQYACSQLPFGGVGASGMGQYHGHAGFMTFSKAMPVLHQARWTVLDRLRPPYAGVVDRVVRALSR